MASAEQVLAKELGISVRDARDLVNTIIAEAGGEGYQGMLAAAFATANRAAVRNQSLGRTVRERGQYEGYSQAGSGSRKNQRRESIQREAIRAIRDAVKGLVDDPTMGADHFLNKKTVQQRSGGLPRWARTFTETATIGGHTFLASPQAERLYAENGGKAKTERTKELQQALQSAGYDVGGVDGIEGPKTKQAVRDFQRDYGLDVDGVVGSQTRTALEAVAESAKQGGVLSAPVYDVQRGILADLPRERPQYQAPDMNARTLQGYIDSAKVTLAPHVQNERQMDGLSTRAQSYLDTLTSSLPAGSNYEIISAHRNPEKNRSVQGAKNSAHQTGDALDFTTAGKSDAEKMNLLSRAIEAAPGTGMGAGFYGDNSIHVDVAPWRDGAQTVLKDGTELDGKTVWDRSRNSIRSLDQVPNWARDILSLQNPGESFPTPRANPRRGTGIIDATGQTQQAQIPSDEPISQAQADALRQAGNTIPRQGLGHGVLTDPNWSPGQTPQMGLSITAGDILPATDAYEVPGTPRSRPDTGTGGFAGWRSGDQDEGVFEVQSALERAGYSPGQIDGRFGPRTERAVREFQRANGLQVDGIVGEQTIGALSNAGSGTGGLPTVQAPRERPQYAPDPFGLEQGDANPYAQEEEPGLLDGKFGKGLKGAAMGGMVGGPFGAAIGGLGGYFGIDGKGLLSGAKDTLSGIFGGGSSGGGGLFGSIGRSSGPYRDGYTSDGSSARYDGNGRYTTSSGRSVDLSYDTSLTGLSRQERSEVLQAQRDRGREIQEAAQRDREARASDRR